MCNRAVFPAYAGMIPMGVCVVRTASSVPRIRGDDPHKHRIPVATNGVFPAYAGMIPWAYARLCSDNRVPRIRGDDPKNYATGEKQSTCSPHTRG